MFAPFNLENTQNTFARYFLLLFEANMESSIVVKNLFLGSFASRFVMESIYYTLLSGYCHRENEGGVPRKNWTTRMSGMYLFNHLYLSKVSVLHHAS